MKQRARYFMHLIATLIVLLGIGCLSAAPEPSVKADFYVSVDGNDRWSGTLPTANSPSSDGPFATLARARDAVRELKKTPLNRDVVVLVRMGLCRLDETLVFGPENSGTDGASIIYAAYPGEEPAVDATYAMNHLHFLKETESCWVENVLEELDQPGEWVLNTKAGKLYLWPRDGNVPKNILAPTLREMVRIEGSIDKRGFADA